MQNGKRQIIYREPFSRSGEVIVKAATNGNQIPDKACVHNMDRDFEVPYITFKLTALAEGAVVDPQPTVLDRFIQVRLMDNSRAQLIGEAVPLQVVDQQSTFRWTPEKPFTLRRGDAWQITINGRESFDIAFDGQRKRLDAIRVEVAFEGELLTYEYLAVPSVKPSEVGVESPLG